MSSRPAILKALFSVLVWGASFIATKVALPRYEMSRIPTDGLDLSPAGRWK